MTENGENGKFLDKKNNVWLASAGILTLGLIVGGYLLGDGLLRAKMADRSVTVRGLAEREVTADLATWTIAYSAQSTNLQAAQQDMDQDTAAITVFFKELGFKADALKPTGANVNQYSSNGIPRYTIRQRLSLRTDDIEKAQAAVARQFDLVRRGVVLEDGSGMSYTFTKLDEIKPEMVAEATKDARKSAEQFAKDSGTDVGGIKSATQGYFSINSRDGDGGGYGVTDTPYKKVRVVTTVNFYLD
ncbi:SIMPL domain-containing protein [Parasphingorhabdus sp.]|uniref:SIMPL domain-containing protein n=1 Tax=Parasphingorhabdus sp. TaxID=2709688 RepID=UPI0032644F86